MATKWGNEFLVNTTTDYGQSNPRITALADGSFMASWNSLFIHPPFPPGTTDREVMGQRFSADGGKFGSEFTANTTTTGNQGPSAVTSLADGKYVVAYSDLSETGGDTSLTAVRAQIF
jgi:hypothetical protein